MSEYEFQSVSHRTLDGMLRAIAESWLSADGLNGPAEFRETLAEDSSSLANEVVEAWGLNVTSDPDHDEDEPGSHMSGNGYDSDDLANAFDELRDRLMDGIAGLPLDLQDEAIRARFVGQSVEIHHRGDIICLWLPDQERGGLSVSAKGTGDSQWTEADDIDDAFRRYAEDDMDP